MRSCSSPKNLNRQTQSTNKRSITIYLVPRKYPPMLAAVFKWQIYAHQNEIFFSGPFELTLYRNKNKLFRWTQKHLKMNNCHFAVITDLNCPRCVSISFGHFDFWIFSSISQCKFLQIITLNGLFWWMAIFNSYHRFSVGFKSGFWFSHSNAYLPPTPQPIPLKFLLWVCWLKSLLEHIFLP